MSDAIRYVDDVAPDLSGAYGKAWKVDTAGLWERLGRQGAHPELTVADWIIEAPYAHPLWHSYLLVCFSLRPHDSVQGDAHIYLPGATHELVLRALDPGHRRALNDVARCLLPSNFAAQIIADSDQSACQRIEYTVHGIIDGVFNPDTDHRRAWSARFGDNMIKPEWRGMPEGMIGISGDTVTVIGTGAAVTKAIGAVPPKPDPKDVH